MSSDTLFGSGFPTTESDLFKELGRVLDSTRDQQGVESKFFDPSLTKCFKLRDGSDNTIVFLLPFQNYYFLCSRVWFAA